MISKPLKIKIYTFNILLIIIFVSFLSININVVNFGDDYYFMQYRNYNFAKYFKHLFTFYCTDNGRFIIHLLVTLFLKVPMIFWQIFNSFMLTAICFFIAKLTSNNGKNNNLILIVSFFLLSSIGIEVTRQSVYWLTGSFNYVYPCMMLLIYAYFLTKIDNKKYFMLSIIFGFLSSATMEQSAVMTVGLTFLVLIYKIISFKGIKETCIDNKKIIILLLITIIGACSVLLAPAQFNRIKLETQNISFKEQIIENIKLILNFYTQSTTMFYFGIVLLISIFFYIFQNENNLKIKLLMIALDIFSIVLLIDLCFFGYYVKLLKYAFIFLLAMLLLYCNKKIYNSVISQINVAVALLVGSQGMMIISPVLGYRNFIFGLIAFLLIISRIISKLEFKRYFLLILYTSLFVSALYFNNITSHGYYNNKLIHEKNIAIIKNSDKLKLTQDNSITLYKYGNDDYAWSMPYFSKFHLKYFKKENGIDCNIDWK